MLKIETYSGAIVYSLDKFLCVDGVRTDIDPDTKLSLVGETMIVWNV